MATTIAKLNIHLGATTAELAHGFSEGIRLTQAFAKNVTGVTSAGGGGGGGSSFASLLGLGGLPGKLAAIATAAATTVFSLAAVNESIHRMDSTAETAANLGATTEELTRLHYAAQLFGSSAEQVDQGLAKMDLKLGQARAGSESAAKAFTDLGLDVDKLANMAPGEAFAEIAGKIDALPTAADKAAAAFEVFGRGGQQLLGVLALGKDGLAQMAAESDFLGQTLSGEQSRAAGQAADALDRMMAAVTGIGNVIVGDFGDDIAFGIDMLTYFLVAIKNIITAAGEVQRGFKESFEFFTGISLQRTGDTEIPKNLAREFNKLAEAEKAATESTKGFEDELKHLADEGRRVTESVRTPLESYEARITQLNLLVTRGAISWETYQRATSKAVEELEKATSSQKTFNAAAAPQIGAVTRNSSAGFSAVFSAIAENQKLLEQAKQQVEQQKAANRRLEEIKRNTAKPAVRVKEVNI